VHTNTALAVKVGSTNPPEIERTDRDPPRSEIRYKQSTHHAEQMMEVCEAMIDICAALFNVSSKEMRQTGRTGQDAARVRQIAMYVTHVTLGLNMHQVGRGFGRDRGTVRHACIAVEDLREDLDFDRAVTTAERVARAAFNKRLEV
jgi:chromosomal replication initiation ATPase DnaA